MDDPKNPKLLRHKPSKEQLSKLKKERKMANHSSPTPPPTTPPPASFSPPKKSFIRRMVPFLLTANLAVGAYVLLRTTKKEPAKEGEDAIKETPLASSQSTAVTDTEKVPIIEPTKPAPEDVKVLPQISDDEQRHLFKWILDEKRKAKTKDALEMKKLDEEKAILKHYISSKSALPTF